MNDEVEYYYCSWKGFLFLLSYLVEPRIAKVKFIERKEPIKVTYEMPERFLSKEEREK